MDGQPLAADAGEGGQQVAEPHGAAQHSDRPDFERRVRRCRASCSGPGGKLASQIKKKSEEEERRESAAE